MGQDNSPEIYYTNGIKQLEAGPYKAAAENFRQVIE